jgi:hypothetical protein
MRESGGGEVPHAINGACMHHRSGAWDNCISLGLLHLLHIFYPKNPNHFMLAIKHRHRALHQHREPEASELGALVSIHNFDSFH